MKMKCHGMGCQAAAGFAVREKADDYSSRSTRKTGQRLIIGAGEICIEIGFLETLHDFTGHQTALRIQRGLKKPVNSADCADDGNMSPEWQSIEQVFLLDFTRRCIYGVTARCIRNDCDIELSG
jgi:hypothetical protein